MPQRKVHQVIGGVNQDLNDFDSLTGDLADTVYELLNINGITLYNENNEVVKLIFKIFMPQQNLLLNCLL